MRIGTRGKAAKEEALELHGELWLGREGGPALGGARLRLLEGIAATSSLARAAEAAGVSYRTAWSLVSGLNALSRAPLVESAPGGPGGGGTRLTAHGKELLALARGLRREHARYLERLSARTRGLSRLAAAARRLSLATSARNQLHGTVVSLRVRGLAAEVVLRLGAPDGRAGGPGRGGPRLTARITREGLESLGLRKGSEAFALVKANYVAVEAPARAGARGRGPNRLPARLSARREEGGMLERVLGLSGGVSLVSSLPTASAAAADAKEGDRVLAVVDPGDVILGVAP